MCRHLAYAGPPRTLHEVLFAPEYSLHVQAYAPRMSQAAVLNADGFGVGWYTAERDSPVRYRRAQPMWTDVSFADVAGAVRSGAIVAAVRSATVGFPVDESCAQPFTDHQRLFSHNGRIEDFGSVEAKLRELAGDLAPLPDARAPVDSALLFAMAAGQWRDGASLADGLAHVVRTVTALAGGRYNLLASDGDEPRRHHLGRHVVRPARPRTVRRHRLRAVRRRPGWEEVPDHSLVTADLDGVTVTPL